MIIISGTSLEVTDLPLSNVLEYSIENNSARLKIKMKTVAKSDDCSSIYLHQDYEGKVEVTQEIKSKLQYFKDDKTLLKILQKDNIEGKLIVSEEEEKEEIKKPVVPITPKISKINTNVPKADKIVPRPTTGLKISQKEVVMSPNIKNKISNFDVHGSKDFEIQMKNQEILELRQALENEKARIRDIYRLQESQLSTQMAQHESEIITANNMIKQLQNHIESLKLSPEHENFLQYATYAYTPNAVLNAGFTVEEIEQIGNLTSNITVISCGSGESLHDMLNSVYSLMSNYKNNLIVDFTYDYYFANRLKMENVTISSTDLNNDSIAEEDLVLKVGESKFIPTAFHHDISLLTMDWVKIIKKLLKIANGDEIIILLNSVSSFSVLYTLEKLSVIARMLIFANSSPLVLSTLYGQIQYLDSTYVTIVATGFYPGVLELVETLGDMFSVNALPDGEEVNWAELLNT